MPLERLLSYRKTLAFRLTLWYGGVFAVCSCIAFLLFYTMITSVFRERTDQELLAQSREFSATLSTRGLDAVKSLAMLEAQAAGVKKVFFRLLSSRGEVFSSSNMSYWQDIDIREHAIKELLRDRKSVFETVTIPNRIDKVRVVHVLVGTGVILQIGQSMEADSRFIDAFKLFDLVFIVTRGGPGDNTESISFFTYTIGFKYFDLGLAAALSVLQLIIIIAAGKMLLTQLSRVQDAQRQA